MALLRAAKELAPPGCEVETASIRGIPLYDGDVEAKEGLPEVVRQLKERIAQADGLLLVTPEYTGRTVHGRLRRVRGPLVNGDCPNSPVKDLT